jgi:putative NIF3 family GTP cyclohydrolase 1 type 2
MVNFVLIMKKVTIVGTNISPKQWSNLILELNLIRKQWNSYAQFELQGTGVKKIIKHGTNVFKDK